MATTNDEKRIIKVLIDGTPDNYYIGVDGFHRVIRDSGDSSEPDYKDVQEIGLQVKANTERLDGIGDIKGYADKAAMDAAGVAYEHAMKDTNEKIEKLGTVFNYKGQVDYYNDLPSSGVKAGDVYTVKWAGESGKKEINEEYVWCDEMRIGDEAVLAHWESLGGGDIAIPNNDIDDIFKDNS